MVTEVTKFPSVRKMINFDDEVSASKLVFRNRALLVSNALGWLFLGLLSLSKAFNVSGSFVVILVVVGCFAGYLSCSNDKGDKLAAGLKWGFLSGFYFWLGLFLGVLLLFLPEFGLTRIVGTAVFVFFPSVILASMAGIISRFIREMIITQRSYQYKTVNDLTPLSISLLVVMLFILFGALFSNSVVVIQEGGVRVFLYLEGYLFVSLTLVFSVFVCGVIALGFLYQTSPLIIGLLHESFNRSKVIPEDSLIDRGELFIRLLGFTAILIYIYWLIRFIDPNLLTNFADILMGKGGTLIELDPMIVGEIGIWTTTLIIPAGFGLVYVLFEYEKITLEDFHNIE
ncbi:MAG: hypothetical protein ACXAC7_06925 [Candidatus Hodarchaeales archaeon]|jgi:hypothetical protein